jgi:hypothetical protein
MKAAGWSFEEVTSARVVLITPAGEVLAGSAPAAAATMTAASGMCNAEPAPVAAASPAANNSESPGRKNPISSPVSANSITNNPSAP